MNNKVLTAQNQNGEIQNDGGLNRRKVLGIIAGAVLGTAALARETLAGEVKVAQVKTALTNDAGIITASTNTQKTELEKSGNGTYAELVEQTLHTKDNKVILLVTQEAESYIKSFPENQRVLKTNELYEHLGDVLANAKGKMPTKVSSDFVVKALPQLLIAFIPNTEYPNLVILGKEAKADKRIEAADKRIEAENKKLEAANKKLKEEQEFGDKLRKLTGSKS